MIKRRWPDTILMAAIGIGLVLWSLYLLHNSCFFGTLVGAFGLAFVIVAVLGPASGKCPLCDQMLHGFFALMVGECERCPHCRCYFRGADRREVPTNHISNAPEFAIPIGDDEPLPSLCCVCAAPADHIKEVVRVHEGGASQVSVTRTVLKVPVPYCSRHDNGVQICLEDLAPSQPLLSGTGKTDKQWVLKVRSYGFYRAAIFG